MNVDVQEKVTTGTPLVNEAPPAQLPAKLTDTDTRGTDAPKPRRTREPSIANIATAIANVTREVGIVAKAGFNQFHRYHFAQMQDVLQRITPLIAKHGLVIMQTEIARHMFDDDKVVSVQYEFTIAHTSGEVWPDRPKQTGMCRCRDSKGGFDDKALNKCHTAARKYFLLALFQIATGEEDDADRGHNDAPRRPAAPAKNVMVEPPYPPHDEQTGEVQESGVSTPQADATQPADPPGSRGAEGTGAGEGSEAIAESDRKLSDAAREGSAALRAAWNKIPKEHRTTLKTALDQRHKPIATEIDLRRAKETTNAV